MILKVRDAMDEDAPVLDIIRRQAIESTFPEEYERTDFADLVARPNEELEEWISSDDVLVPLIETRYTPACFGAFDRRAASILALYTAPEYEGQGYAERLLKRFEKEAREMGGHTISVHSPLPAASFFKQLDYHEERKEKVGNIMLVELQKEIPYDHE